jgi:hypothetical protein
VQRAANIPMMYSAVEAYNNEAIEIWVKKTKYVVTFIQGNTYDEVQEGTD